MGLLGPLSLVAKGIEYRIRCNKQRNKYKIGHEKEWKTILNNINVCVQPKQLLAIMGPSGSGKTTLLNALANRVRVGRDHELKGEVLFNGKPSVGLVSKFSNYVMQQDHLMSFLTVYETIAIAADLKLKRMSKIDRRKRVERVIDELGLVECRDVRIGDEMVKGISGGQKKRVSIAIELLDEPSLLFLDEPTSGLDSSLAYDVLRILVNLARGGRTVVCTVHQPRSQVFTLFDQLLLLNKGRVVYHGPAHDTTRYFGELGFPCPPQFNPADFFLDLLSGYKAPAVVSDTTKAILVGEGEDNSQPTVAELGLEHVSFAISEVPRLQFADEDEALNFPVSFAASHECSVIMEKIENIVNSAGVSEGQQPLAVDHSLHHSNRPVWDWFRSFMILSRRVWLNSIRNPMEGAANLLINLAFGFIIGGLFYQLEEGGTGTAVLSNAANFAGCIFFAITQYSFSQLNALITFPKERALYNRESANGLYYPSAYYMAQNVAKLPFQQIPPLLFGIIVYWMAGFGPTFIQFFQNIIVATLIVFASVGYCYLMGAAFPSLEVVNLVAPTGLVVFMILSGYLLRDDQIPSWIGWFKYFSFMRHGFLAFCQIQFPPGGYFGEVPNEDIVDFLGVPHKLNTWLITFFLLLCGLIMRLIGFFLLAYTNTKYGIE